MADEFTLPIHASFDAIEPANDAASRWLEDRNVPPAAQYLANLTIEELVTNCIKYGYDNPGEHTIEITLQISDVEMAVTVKDDGHPFNPLELPVPDTNLPVEDRPIGGLGIHLLRRMSDRMEYVRAEGRNCVTVRKSIRNSTAGP